MSARDELVRTATDPNATNWEILRAIDVYRDEIREEIADDVHRAELPRFASTENPELVTKTVRAIDVRLISDGQGAPYWLDKAKKP